MAYKRAASSSFEVLPAKRRRTPFGYMLMDDDSASGIPSTEPTRKPSVGFLDLPRELRDKIYGLVLTSENGGRRVLEPIHELEAESIRKREEYTRLWPQSPHIKHVFLHRGRRPPPKILDIGLMYANRQIYAEVTEVLMKESIIKFAREIDRPYPHVRRRFKTILTQAYHLYIAIDPINRQAWWLKILQAKTNLHTLMIHIRGVEFYGKWIEYEKKAKDDLRALAKIKVINNAQLVVRGKDIQDFVNTELAPSFFAPD